MNWRRRLTRSWRAATRPRAAEESGQGGAGVGEVEGDLGLEGGEVGEFFFVAEFFHEGQFEFGAVEVAGEIEEVGFDVDLRRGLGARGAEANVQRGGVRGVASAREDGVNAVGREDLCARVEVGGGEAELAPDLIAGNDGAGEGVGAAEHLTGGVEAAGADGFADARAADGLAVERDGGEAVNREIKFSAEAAKELDVAAAAMAEGELCADANAVDLAEIADESADEFLGGLFAEGAVEVQEQRGVHAEGFDGAEFLWQGTNQRRHAVRRDDGGGVGIEGDDDGARGVLARVHQRLPDDLLMAEMNAIERADREADAARVRREFKRAAEKLHGPRKRNWCPRNTPNTRNEKTRSRWVISREKGRNRAAANPDRSLCFRVFRVFRGQKFPRFRMARGSRLRREFQEGDHAAGQIGEG